MSWALIAVKGVNLRLLSTAIDLLADQGEEVSKVFIDADDSIAYVDENGPSASRVVAGQEGLGFYINRCIEACNNYDSPIDWFLVIGGVFDPELSHAQLEDAIAKAVKTRQTVVSLGGRSLMPSISDIVGMLLERWRPLLSAGEGGCMIIPKVAWIDVSGFREDIGSWGIELHFALDILSKGNDVLAIPWTAGSGCSKRDANTHLVSALVAHATYSEGRKLPSRINFWTRSWGWHVLIKPKASLNSFLRAREILRTREFFESGR